MQLGRSSSVPGAGWGFEPTPLRLAMFPSNTCLYSSSMVIFVWWLFAVRCNKVLVQTWGGEGWAPTHQPGNMGRRWMVSPGLPSISSGSPQTQGMTFADLLGYFKQGHLFFFSFFQ